MSTRIVFSSRYKLLSVTRRISELPEQAEFPQNSHASLEIVLCKRGRISYRVEDTVYPFPPDTLIAIAPGVSHQILVGGDADYERISVIAKPELLPRGAIRLFKGNCICLHLRAGDPLLSLLARAEEYATVFPQKAQHLLHSALATELYFRLIARADELPETASDPVNRALAYIEAHLTEIRQISEISSALYLSANYFHKLFRRHVGKTPLEYLTERRLSLARIRIASGERPSAVAAECGFREYTSFYRSYRRLFGRSPSDLSHLRTEELS